MQNFQRISKSYEMFNNYTNVGSGMTLSFLYLKFRISFLDVKFLENVRIVYSD